VGKWDKELIENGNKIMRLYEDATNVQISQRELDQNLEFIKSQQQELETLVDQLDTEVEGLYKNLETEFQPADRERERAWTIAEDLDNQLNQTLKQLTETVTALNENQAKNIDQENPVNQIVKILNSHLNAMQWIDKNTVVLQEKLDQVTKLTKNRQAELDTIRRLQTYQ